MTPAGQCVPDVPAHCFDVFLPWWERDRERERPHSWRENVFPRSETCRVFYWNSCWKHQGLWMLAGLLRKVVPQVPSNTPPSALPCFGLCPIQHVCFTLLLSQPSFSLNNYLPSSSFVHFFSSETFALLHSLYLLPPSIHLSHLLLGHTSSCLRSPSPSYSLSAGVRRKGSLMHLPWQELDQDVWLLAMTFSWLVFSAVWGHQDTFS